VSDSQHPTLLAIANCFLRIGLQGFGGLGAVLTILTRELVDRCRWLREEGITSALTYTKLLPGSTVVQVVAYLGWKLHSFTGAMVATIAFLLPSFLLMLSVAVSYRALALAAGISAALAGLTAAVVGVLVPTIWTLGRKNITDWGGIAVALTAFIASVWLKANPAVLVVAAGLWRVWVETRRASV